MSNIIQYKLLESMVRSEAEYFIRVAKSSRDDLNVAIADVEAWLKDGDLSKWHKMNSLGILQYRGPGLDVSVGKICILAQIIGELK